MTAQINDQMTLSPILCGLVFKAERHALLRIRRNEKVRWLKTAFAVLLLALFLAQSTSGLASTEDEQNNIDVYREAAPGVVNITTVSVERDFFFNIVPRQGAGSGSIINKQGYILTNYHVIRDARRLEITLADGSKWQGKLVGTDTDNDLAVIKIDAPPRRLTVIPVGDSDQLLVGQKVLAIVILSDWDRR